MKAKRIGDRMHSATAYVAGHPGCSKYEVSVAVGPHGSNSYGDRIVLRAIRAGLIENRSPEGSWFYALHVTDAGRELLKGEQS
jgi:hypothetical protein